MAAVLSTSEHVSIFAAVCGLQSTKYRKAAVACSQVRGLVPFHFRTTKLQANDKSLYAQQQTLDEQSVEHGHVGALELCLCEVEGPQLEMWREGPGKRAELR